MPTHKGDGFRPLTFPLNMTNGVEAVTLTGDLDLTARYGNMLALDPGGANRNVDIDEADAHLKWRPFWLYNAADAPEAITVRDSADATVSVLAPGESCLVHGDGSTLHLLGKATSSTASAAISDPGTGAAIPVTRSGSVAITTAAAETNTLADPAFMGQWLSIFVDTYAVGNRVITAASRINQAANTVITLGAVGDFIKLEAVTIAGALKWQVVSNDGAALS
jgi:hypothetical protein